MSAMLSKPYLTPNEAASLLMVAPATLRVWTEKGVIRALTTPGGHRRFPREEVERLCQARNPAGLASDTRRILIVDDEPALTRYLSILLGSQEGVVTAQAQDGFSAGQQIHTFRPHILLLDLMMPGLDGFQVCRQIKDQATTRHIRVVAMTGYPSPENVTRILANGAEACLAKPLDEEALFAAMKFPQRTA
jgi:excisionase family DNA binding protein